MTRFTDSGTWLGTHYRDVKMSAMASQITSLTIVYVFRRISKKTSKLRVTVLSLSLSPVNSPHKAPVTQKMFPYDDVIMWPSKLPMSVHRQQFLYGVWLRAADRSYGTVHGVQLNCLPNFMYTNRNPQKKPLYRLGANLAMEFSS